MTTHGDESEASVQRILTREQFLRGGSAAALGLWSFSLIGCGGGDEAATTATGATAAKKRGGILKFSSGGFIPQDSLDPLKNISDHQDVVQSLFAEPLVQLSFEFESTPGLAESWESSDDFREWTFKLRQNVKWHDGRPFTAEDVVFSLLRHIDKDAGSGHFARLSPSYDAKGVTAVDDHTVRLQLKRPDSLILLPFGTNDANIVPAGTKGKEYEKGIGTGPFGIKSWTPGRSFEAVRYPDYWGEQPYLDGVRGTQIPEASTRAQSVLTGGTHLTALDYSSLPTVKRRKSAKVVAAKGQQYLNVVMDNTKAPFDDPKVRKAIQLAINRERFKAAAFHDYAVITADVPTIPEDRYFPAVLKPLMTQNLEESKRLLAEAGHPDGLDLTLKVSAVELDSAFALAVADALSDSNVRVKVDRHPAATYWDEVWLKDDFYVSTWNRRHPVEGMTSAFKSTAVWNESNFKDPRLDELLDKAFTVEGDELEKVVQEALTILGESATQLIPAIRDRLWLVNSDVVDFAVRYRGLIDLGKTSLA